MSNIFSHAPVSSVELTDDDLLEQAILQSLLTDAKKRENGNDRSNWQTSQCNRIQLGLGMVTPKKAIQMYKDSMKQTLCSPNNSRVANTTAATSMTTGPAAAGAKDLSIDNSNYCFGKFKNSSFFGKGREELLDISEGVDGTYSALKLVGDAHVPRGKISWRSIKPQSVVDVFGTFSHKVGTPFQVEFQVRNDVEDENDYSWIQTFGRGSIVMQYMTRSDSWKLSFLEHLEDQAPAHAKNVTAEYSFGRVSDEEAEVMMKGRDWE